MLSALVDVDGLELGVGDEDGDGAVDVAEGLLKDAGLADAVEVTLLLL